MCIYRWFNRERPAKAAPCLVKNITLEELVIFLFFELPSHAQRYVQFYD